MSEYLAFDERTGLVTGFALGPVIGRWNKYLEFRFPLPSRRDTTTSFIALSKRVVVDQIFMAPIGVCIHRTDYMLCSLLNTNYMGFVALCLSKFYGCDGRSRFKTHPC